MSGHNKWSKIKHKKGKEDARRGKVFTKVIKEITIASRSGGGDPDGNPRLAAAMAAAKANNMPKDTIERAIRRGTGEDGGAAYEEYVYEGYGPGGVAVMVEVATDNKNRTVAEVRHFFSKYNGNLGESGCVSFLFEKIGLLAFPKSEVEEDTLMEALLEIDAGDYEDSGDDWEVRTTQTEFERVRSGLEERGLVPVQAEISAIPKSLVPIEGKPAESLMKLLTMLEDSDDVQNVYANFEMDDALLERLSG